MKKISILILLCLSISSFSQTDNNEKSVKFTIIDEVPVFKGCEDSPDKKKCLQKSITGHFQRKFNTSLFQNVNLKPGIKRVFIMFRINSAGKVDSIKVKAPHKSMTTEAVRVTKLLPHFKPGILDNEPVGVKYALPLVFKVEKTKARKKKKRRH